MTTCQKEIKRNKDNKVRPNQLIKIKLLGNRNIHKDVMQVFTNGYRSMYVSP